MSLQGVIAAVIAGLLAAGMVELWIRRRKSRIPSRVLDRAHHAGRYAPESGLRLQPENQFIVRVSDAEINCERPDETIERVGWSELQKVEVVTTGDGPFAPDVFWVLHGASGGCVVPQGATGDKELLERLQTLPGFDNQVFIEAMSSSSDGRFLCWQRKA